MPDPETGERPVSRCSNCSTEYVPTGADGDVFDQPDEPPESPTKMCDDYLAELDRETAQSPAGDERAEGLSALQAAVGNTGSQQQQGDSAAAVDIVAEAMRSLEPAEPAQPSSTRRRSRK
jgi:hypothetical protein